MSLTPEQHVNTLRRLREAREELSRFMEWSRNNEPQGIGSAADQTRRTYDVITRHLDRMARAHFSALLNALDNGGSF
jgi:hypothetical protein